MKTSASCDRIWELGCRDGEENCLPKGLGEKDVLQLRRGNFSTVHVKGDVELEQVAATSVKSTFGSVIMEQGWARQVQAKEGVFLIGGHAGGVEASSGMVRVKNGAVGALWAGSGAIVEEKSFVAQMKVQGKEASVENSRVKKLDAQSGAFLKNSRLDEVSCTGYLACEGSEIGTLTLRAGENGYLFLSLSNSTVQGKIQVVREGLKEKGFVLTLKGSRFDEGIFFCDEE